MQEGHAIADRLFGDSRHCQLEHFRSSIRGCEKLLGTETSRQELQPASHRIRSNSACESKRAESGTRTNLSLQRGSRSKEQIPAQCLLMFLYDRSCIASCHHLLQRYNNFRFW
ncbi:hypothetical protein BT69DRAFT_171229 [Atractiella rhizophila]|nr:hypothetical protein BT69DRAFT_171229 [Atractiella rhizophila]